MCPQQLEGMRSPLSTSMGLCRVTGREASFNQLGGNGVYTGASPVSSPSAPGRSLWLPQTGGSSLFQECCANSLFLHEGLLPLKAGTRRPPTLQGGMVKINEN